jgi:hypothetical protein
MPEYKKDLLQQIADDECRPAIEREAARPELAAPVAQSPPSPRRGRNSGSVIQPHQGRHICKRLQSCAGWFHLIEKIAKLGQPKSPRSCANSPYSLTMAAGAGRIAQFLPPKESEFC